MSYNAGRRSLERSRLRSEPPSAFSSNSVLESADNNDDLPKECDMRMTNGLCRIIARVGAGVLIGALVTACQPQESSPGLEIDNDDIGGVVASENGPEAGVWVIAETSDLDTRFVRIVVTDDQGGRQRPSTD